MSNSKSRRNRCVVPHPSPARNGVHMSFLNVATTLPPGLIKPPTDTPDVFLKRFLRMFFFTEHNFSGPPQYYIDPPSRESTCGGRLCERPRNGGLPSVRIYGRRRQALQDGRAHRSPPPTPHHPQLLDASPVHLSVVMERPRSSIDRRGIFPRTLEFSS